MDEKTRRKLEAKARSRGIATRGEDGYERHVLLCGGPHCCGAHEGEQTAKYLQKRLAQLSKAGRHIYCSRVNCLCFCRGGPLLVVYPEGVWYGGVTPEACERIIQEHLLEGRVVEEFAFARNPLLPHDEAPVAGGD